MTPDAPTPLPTTAEKDAGLTCEPKCHGYGIGCACSPRVTGALAAHFCGQTQPHDAHTWQTPQVYGLTMLVSTYQCGGFTAYVTPPPRFGSCCFNVGTPECVCANPTTVLPPGVGESA